MQHEGESPSPPVTAHIIQQQRGIPFTQPVNAYVDSTASSRECGISPAPDALGTLRDHTIEKLEKLELAVTKGREETHEDILKLASWLEHAQIRQMKATKCLFDRIEVLECAFMRGSSPEEDQTLTLRLKRIESIMHELLGNSIGSYDSMPPGSGSGDYEPPNTFRDIGVDAIPSMSVMDASIEARLPDLAEEACLPDLADGALTPKQVDAETATSPQSFMDGLTNPDVTMSIEMGVEAQTQNRNHDAVDVCAIVQTDSAVAPAAISNTGTRRTSECRSLSPSGLQMSLFGTGRPLQTLFPTSPYNSDPMVPAKWSPLHEDNVNASSSDSSGSPDSQLSYLVLPEEIQAPIENLDAEKAICNTGADNHDPESPSANMTSRSSPLRTLFDAADVEDDPWPDEAANTGPTAPHPSRPNSPATGSEIGGAPPSSHRDGPFFTPTSVTPAPSPHVSLSIESKEPDSVSASMSTNSAAHSNLSPTAVNPSPSVQPSLDGSASPKHPVHHASTSSAPLSLPRNLKKLKTGPTSKLTIRPVLPSLPVSPLSDPLSSLSSLSSHSSDSPPALPLPLPRARPRPVISQSQPAQGRSGIKVRRGSVDVVPSRESSDIETIEKPEVLVSRIQTKGNNNFRRRGRKLQTRLGHEKHTDGSRKSQRVTDTQKPRKRRKTEADAGDIVPGPSKLRKRRRKSLNEAAATTSACPSTMSKDLLEVEDALYEWPAKIDGDATLQRKFVQCDNCDAWYHFGCVGLTADDPRLQEDALFMCPPCEVSQRQRERKYSKSVHDAACARSDCNDATAPSERNEWFIDRIVGRRLQWGEGNERNHDPKFLWLVKWDGWTVRDATWTLQSDLGDVARHIEQFEVAAELEGHDLTNLRDIMVLNEAAVVGW